MKLLLDTHVVLWAATSPAKLGPATRAALEDGRNQVLVSAVTAWEIAIKQSIGKLVLPLPAEEWLPDVLRASGFDVVAVTLHAALRVRALPWHHRDPFDRLLIAQAFESDSTVVTRDAVFASYGVAVLDA